MNREWTQWKPLRLLCAAMLVLGLVMAAQPPRNAEAVIGFVRSVGTAATKAATGTTITVTVPVAGVAAGNSLIVSFAMDPASGTVNAADSRGNTYAVDADVTNLGGGGNGVRTVILSAHNVTALTSGDLITVTHPSALARAVSVAEFSGLAQTGTLDRISTATGNSTTPNSGATATTREYNELLIGALGIDGPVDDTFTPGTGYTALSRTGTASGGAPKNITINPEYQVVSATGAYAANGALDTGRRWAAAIATYRMALPTVQFASSTYSVNEAAGTAAITLMLNAATTVTVTVPFTTTNGTAAAGSDYVDATGIITFAPGVTTTTATVPIISDSTDEVDETVALALGSPTNGFLGAPAAATLTILDDDGPTVQFSAATYNVDEGDASATITATLSVASVQTVTVDYATSDSTATAGSDYVTATGTLTFTPGATSQTFSVSVTDDALDEADEALALALSSPNNATLGAPNPASLTISDNDAAPTVQFGNVTYTADEGAGTTSITVTLSAASVQTVTVDYATSDSTATAGSDYVTATGTLTFTPGATSQTFSVSVTDDALDEADEALSLTLSSPNNASLGAPNPASLTISDNDAAPTVQFDAADYTATEGAGSATITVTLSAASGQTVTVDYATSDNTAQAGSDYSTASGTLTFTPGVTEQTFSVTVLDDLLDEIPTELVTLSLSGATNATLGAQSTADLQITDNDNPPTVQFDAADYSAGEGVGTATITVTLSASSGQTVTVDYATADNTALAGSDYVTATGTLTFTPGMTTQTFAVAVVNDTTPEASEALTLTLSVPVNATVGSPAEAALNIIDDDTVTDLAILKTDNQLTLTAGSLITYTITVSNQGAVTAVGATVSDTLPAAITGAAWTCVASPGSSCAASGAGHLNDSLTLLPGGSATYTLSGTVALTAVGTLTNTVTVDLPLGLTDSNTGNNTAVDTTEVLPPIPVTGNYQVFLPLIQR